MAILEKIKNEVKIIGKKRLLLAVLFLAVLFIVFYFRNSGVLDIEKIIYLFKNYSFSPFLFILIYILMIVFLVPTLPMNLGAGFLWGGFWGCILSLIGTSFGGAMSFIISRYLIHNYFNNRFNSHFWKKILEQMKKNDWKIIAFTRVNPAFPFALTSYFFGLTSVSFFKFILSTVVPIILPTFLFAYIGHSIGGIILKDEADQLFKKVIIVSILFVFVLLFYFAVKKIFFNKKYENNTSNFNTK